MDFIAEFGFDIKQGKAHEFQGVAIQEQEQDSSGLSHRGRIVGTYAAIYSSEKHASADSVSSSASRAPGSQDALAAAMKRAGTSQPSSTK